MSLVSRQELNGGKNLAWQKVRIDLPDGYDASTRAEIGDAIVQFIRDRCAEGQGVKQRGKTFSTYDFPQYTAEYAKKKGQTKVDLVLSEDMLSAMDVLSVSTSSVLIGFENGSKENAKAEGNQIGSYGRKPDPKKARRFLGVTNDELEAILAGFEK